MLEYGEGRWPWDERKSPEDSEYNGKSSEERLSIEIKIKPEEERDKNVEDYVEK